MMSKKIYNIWMAILDDPFEWQDMTTLGKKTDLTSRQVSAIITHMPDERILRENARVKFAGDKAAVEATKREVIMSCFGIEEEDFDKVRAMLSDIGGITIKDICAEVDCNKANVSRILRLMGDVRSESVHDETLYYIDHSLSVRE